MMILTHLGPFVIASSLVLSPTLNKDDGGVFPYPVHRAVLDNGLKVIMIPMPSKGLVSYWSIVRTGSRDEVEEGVTGFAHFFEHIMFKGGTKYPGAAYDAVVNGMGASANAFTTDDYTAYHLSFTKEDLPKVVDIESDRFRSLHYSEEEFKTESGAVYGEYRKGRTSPISVLVEALQNAAFDRHTYKHTTIGFEADIARMPEQYEYSKSFFRRFYRPENVVILVTGDIDTARTLDLVKSAYGGWERGYVAPDVPEEPPQTAQRRITVPFEGQTLPILTVNFKGERLKPADPVMMAATLIGELAFGETSDIYRKLVLNEQRAEFITGYFDENRDPGLWSVFARVKDAGDVRAIEGEIFRTVEGLKRDLVSEERLDAVRSRTKYSFLTSLSTPDGVASTIDRIVAITGDVDAIEVMFDTLDRVTPEDVRRAASRYLTPERSTVAVLHAANEPLPDALAGAEAPVLLPVPADPNVAIRLWFQVGSQDDPPGKEGLAALTATLVSEGGTKSRSYEQILAKLFPLAASYGASVDKEMTVVSGIVHRDVVDPFVEIFLDAVLNPGFRQEDFERLKDRTISGIEKTLRYSSDEDLGKAALHSRIFRGTPYAHIVEGTVAGLKSITLDDVRAFHRARYTRDNVVVGCGGAYAAALPAEISAALARLPEGRPERVPAPEPAPIDGRQVILVEKPGPSTAISFGFPIDLHRGSREFYALWIANSWLGEHRNSSSHLYQVIREARGMNYGDYSYIEAYPNGGRRQTPPTGVARRGQLFEVWIRPVPRDRALFALRAALREVESLVANGLGQKEFEDTRAFLRKYILHFAETTSERLGYAIDDRFYGIEDGHLDRFQAMLGSITLDEVNTAVRKHLRTENMVIAMVTEGAEGLRDAILSGEKSPISYGAIQKPEEILEEDKAIESYPLRVARGAVTIVSVDAMFER